jgi:hypothetical protein
LWLIVTVDVAEITFVNIYDVDYAVCFTKSIDKATSLNSGHQPAKHCLVIDVYKFFCVIDYSMRERAVMAAPLHPENFATALQLRHTLLELARWEVDAIEQRLTVVVRSEDNVSIANSDNFSASSVESNSLIACKRI